LLLFVDLDAINDDWPGTLVPFYYLNTFTCLLSLTDGALNILLLLWFDCCCDVNCWFVLFFCWLDYILFVAELDS
jgi:hypothetical protein